MQVVQYTPNQVKEAVAIRRLTDKEQVQTMVQTLLTGGAAPAPDAADACGARTVPPRPRAHPAGGRPGLPDDRVAAGTLLDRGVGGRELLVEVAGVGYRVTVAPPPRSQWVRSATRCSCTSTTTSARDDQTLHGFPPRGAGLLRGAAGAHGVGPALAPRSCRSTTRLASQQVLADDDLGALCLVPGVGRKTATRLLMGSSPASTSATSTSPGSRAVARQPRASSRKDVHDALEGLGYGPDEIREVLRDLPQEGDSSLLLRLALQRLAVART